MAMRGLSEAVVCPMPAGGGSCRFSTLPAAACVVGEGCRLLQRHRHGRPFKVLKGVGTDYRLPGLSELNVCVRACVRACVLMGVCVMLQDEAVWGREG